MILGKDGNWPSNGNCSSFTTSNSQSSLQNSGVKSPYFKLHSNPETSNLKNLTASDFPKINKGIRSIIPLIAYHHMNARHVQNTDKFCRAWKREKKRRAVGNCLVKGYNNDSLSIGGNTHGIGITRTQRASNSCHPNNKNCSNANSHFQTQYNNLVTAKAQAETDKRNAVTRKNDINSTHLPAATTGCSAPCVVSYTAPSCGRTRIGSICREARYPTLYGGQPGDIIYIDCGARQRCRIRCQDNLQSCLANCDGDADCLNGCSTCESGCGGCTVTGGNRQEDCSVRDAACSRKTSLTSERNNLVNVEIPRLTRLIAQLTREIACATPKLPNAKDKNRCMNNLASVNSHTTSYSPDIVNCSSLISALSIEFDEDALDSRCWSLEKLDPKYTFTFNDGVTNNLSGTIGLIGDTNQDTDWDKNAACNTLPAPKSLYSIPAQCSGHYKDLIDLTDNDLCNDDGINYSSQTCTIP